MDGRSFLDVARNVVSGPNEGSWRTAAGRAYYALFSEARRTLERWGFSSLPRDPVHSFVRLRFQFASDAVLKGIGRSLERLGQLRNETDYQLEQPGHFLSSARATAAITEAADRIVDLDQIDADSARRAAAIADIRSRWP